MMEHWKTTMGNRTHNLFDLGLLSKSNFISLNKRITYIYIIKETNQIYMLDTGYRTETIRRRQNHNSGSFPWNLGSINCLFNICAIFLNCSITNMNSNISSEVLHTVFHFQDMKLRNMKLTIKTNADFESLKILSDRYLFPNDILVFETW